MNNIKANQDNQDLIWDHFQNEGVHSFEKSRPRVNYIVKRLLSGQKILNIGVGGAILEGLALKKEIDIYSLDPSEKAIKRLNSRFHMGNKAKVGYSEEIPFEDEKFNVVIMSEVLEHLEEDSFDVSVGEVSRVLVKNGKFVVTVPFEENLSDNEVVCPHCGEKFHRWGHKQSFTRSKLCSLIEKKGFSIKKVEVRSFPDWERKGLLSKLKAIVRYVLGRLGAGIAQPNIYLVAVKI